MDSYILIIVISVLSAGAVSIVSYYKDQASEKKLKDANDTIINQNLNLTNEQKKYAEQQAKYAEEARQASLKITYFARIK